tara:strand:- start:248508 stop:249617 length:1110 start_codon:yes stop_codon:yes gene_type:complete
MAMSGGPAIRAREEGAPTQVDARELLLRRMCDLAIMPPGKLTSHERGLVDTVVSSAVVRLDVASRRRLGERIAQLPEGPPELTLVLARDEIEVAATVLKNNLGLQDSDLAQIVRDFGPEHHMAIAERKSLPGIVVDALVEMAAPEAICRMLANFSAELSRRALEILVRRSATEAAYQPLLLARPEMNIRAAQLMFWWVSSPARSEILVRYSVERRMMHNALDDVLEAGLAANVTDEALQVAFSLVRPPVVSSRAQIQRLIDQANRHEREGFIAEIVYAGHVRPETAYRIFSDLGGEPIAVFAKAIGMTRAEFADLLGALAGFRGIDFTDKHIAERISTVFDLISNDRADFVLHCWDWAISAEAQMPIEN